MAAIRFLDEYAAPHTWEKIADEVLRDLIVSYRAALSKYASKDVEVGWQS